MKRKGALLWILLFSLGVIKAQTDFRPGFIITQSLDTIYGEIDYRGDLLMSELCKFRDKQSSIKKYFPDDIKAFRFTGSRYFVSREIDGKKWFLEYLIKGKVDIFYMRDKEGDHYYVEKEDILLTEIPYEESIKYIDDKQFSYSSTKHMGILNYFMQDAPEIESQITSMKKPEHNELINLAKDYHEAVCKDEDCIVYGKKAAALKVNIEAVAGIVNYQNIDDLIDKNYFQAGIIVHFWMPRVNEKIYFKTGFLYSQFEKTDSETFTQYKIPIHIGYMAPKTYRIRPTFSIGLLSPSYSAGAVIRINEKINLGVQSWANFYAKTFPWIPGVLYNYSILGNIYFDL